MGGNKQPNMILMSVIFFISVKAERELRPRGTSRAAKSRSTFTSQHNKKVGSIPKKDESITSLPQKRNFFIENFLGKETFRKHYCKKAPRSQMHASKSTRRQEYIILGGKRSFHKKQISTTQMENTSSSSMDTFFMLLRSQLEPPIVGVTEIQYWQIDCFLREGRCRFVCI